MATAEDHVQKALDTLMELCDPTPEGTAHDRQYERKSAAEEILRHYREERTFKKILDEGILIRLQGHVPVRPTTTAQSKGPGRI